MATPFLTDDDVRFLTEGGDYLIYQKLGAHVTEQDGTPGTHFALWAPDAQAVSVIGDFNTWQPDAHPMRPRGTSGLWTCFIPGVGTGALYRYTITTRSQTQRLEKLDPCGFAAEIRPQIASKVCSLSGYAWGDREWMAGRARAQASDAPIAIYEVHLGSWRRVPEQANRWLTYREMAPLLAGYAHQMGFTHVEFLPVSEHLSDESWGYQPVGFFAPTSRFGTPQDFMFLIDTLHQQGLGVILDWVPARFPRNAHGLACLDGTPLYEHGDPYSEEQQDEGTSAFNLGRREVSNFLISNALFWLDKYHIDGLRVDGVASLLHLDPGQKPGTWALDDHGRSANLDAIAFFRSFNQRVRLNYRDALTSAGESTGWHMIAQPAEVGGLGFGLKWDMDWLHDILSYLSLEPIHRKYHHNQLTLRMLYAFMENYILPLSHDAVVPGKRSLLGRMPGDDWQKLANLRLLFGTLYALPGKKLLFMGGEFGQWNSWNPDASLDWHLLDHRPHGALQRWVRDLNTFYRAEPAEHQLDSDPLGFEWVDETDSEQSVLSFLRKGRGPDDVLLVVCNFTPLPRYNYRAGVAQKGHWQEVLNSDAPLYGGSGQGNLGGAAATPISWHGRPYSLNLTLPPLGMVVFKQKG